MSLCRTRTPKTTWLCRCRLASVRRHSFPYLAPLTLRPYSSTSEHDDKTPPLPPTSSGDIRPELDASNEWGALVSRIRKNNEGFVNSAQLRLGRHRKMRRLSLTSEDEQTIGIVVPSELSLSTPDILPVTDSQAAPSSVQRLLAATKPHETLVTSRSLGASKTLPIQPSIKAARKIRPSASDAIDVLLRLEAGSTRPLIRPAVQSDTMVPIPVYITGGSGAIGAAIGRAFANHVRLPFHVTLVGRSEQKLLAALATLKQPVEKFSHSIQTVRGTTFRHWAEFWDHDPHSPWTSVLHLNDPKHRAIPAILVNCVGDVGRGLLMSLTAEQIYATLDANLHNAIHACKFFTSRQAISLRREMMRRWPSGHALTPSIINIGSLLGQQGGCGASIYATSKAGIVGFTRALAAEQGRMGIRVNAVTPGFVDSPMALQEGEARIAKLKKIIPVGRLARPEEVADAVMFLALNNYANNCVLNLDGGLSAVGPLAGLDV